MASRGKALSLYKSILRAHDKFLPRSMKRLGDAYVKSEFRLHRNAKPEQALQFFDEWKTYLQHVERTGRENQSVEVGLIDNTSNNKPSFGKDVSREVSFSEEQRDQLGKLRDEAAKAGQQGGGKI